MLYLACLMVLLLSVSLSSSLASSDPFTIPCVSGSGGEAKLGLDLESGCIRYGEPLSYKIRLENYGHRPFHEVSINDNFGQIGLLNQLSPGEAIILTRTTPILREPVHLWVSASAEGKLICREGASIQVTSPRAAGRDRGFTGKAIGEGSRLEILSAHPDIELSASADPQVVRAGGRSKVKVTVTNHLTRPLRDVEVQGPGWNVQVAELGPEESRTYSKTVVVSEDLSMSLKATGTTDGGRHVSDQERVDISVIHPAISATAIATSASSGRIVTVEYKLKNKGDDPLRRVTLKDESGAVLGILTELSPGEAQSLIRSEVPGLEGIRAIEVACIDSTGQLLVERVILKQLRTGGRKPSSSYLGGSIKFDELDTEFDELDTKLDDLDTGFDELDTKLDDLDTGFDEIDTRLDDLDTEMDAAEFDRLDPTLGDRERRSFDADRPIDRDGITGLINRLRGMVDNIKLKRPETVENQVSSVISSSDALPPGYETETGSLSPVVEPPIGDEGEISTGDTTISANPPTTRASSREVGPNQPERGDLSPSTGDGTDIGGHGANSTSTIKEKLDNEKSNIQTEKEELSGLADRLSSMAEMIKPKTSETDNLIPASTQLNVPPSDDGPGYLAPAAAVPLVADEEVLATVERMTRTAPATRASPRTVRVALPERTSYPASAGSSIDNKKISFGYLDEKTEIETVEDLGTGQATKGLGTEETAGAPRAEATVEDLRTGQAAKGLGTEETAGAPGVEATVEDLRTGWATKDLKIEAVLESFETTKIDRLPNIIDVYALPPEPTAGSPVTVSVHAEDDKGVDSATLLWGIARKSISRQDLLDVDQNPPIEMTLVEGTLRDGYWSCDIPGQPAGTYVIFTVSVSDGKGWGEDGPYTLFWNEIEPVTVETAPTQPPSTGEYTHHVEVEEDPSKKAMFYTECTTIIGRGDVSIKNEFRETAIRFREDLSGYGSIEIASQKEISKGNPQVNFNSSRLLVFDDGQLKGSKTMASPTFHGGMGASVSERFDTSSMEKCEVGMIRNVNRSENTISFDSQQSFEGMWGTKTTYSKFGKKMKTKQELDGSFETQKKITFRD
ncbi:MAG: hypothetical protein U9N48_04455 [Euryarchaeota archaeon]|nr:hypothetical protein [Euryarchaeota archaeon]